ncbi:MAG: hypothetical protein PHE60_05765 [Sulfurospirillaceae bacterium]|nr:hypothetical protein [Sulfurospirillaceae bacterium]
MMLHLLSQTKGGVGKSTISNHILPSLTGSSLIIEIDNNNVSSIYSSSSKIRGVTLKTDKKSIEQAIVEAELNSLDSNIIIDAGGGDDSLKVIEALMAAKLECTVWLPITPDAEALTNLQHIVQKVGKTYPINLVFSRFSKLKEDYYFIFGDETQSANLQFLAPFANILQVPIKNIFSKAKQRATTVWDLATIFGDKDPQMLKKEWQNEYANATDKVAAKELYMQKRAVMWLQDEAQEYLGAVKNSFQSTKDFIKTIQS